jgi:transposase
VGTTPTKEVQVGRRERHRVTDEFKPEVVGLVRSSGRSIPEVTRDLDLTESAVRGWVQRAEVQRVGRNSVSASGWEELGRLLRQVRALKGQWRILEKAAVFFAKDTR